MSERQRVITPRPDSDASLRHLLALALVIGAVFLLHQDSALWWPYSLAMVGIALGYAWEFASWLAGVALVIAGLLVILQSPVAVAMIVGAIIIATAISRLRRP